MTTRTSSRPSRCRWPALVALALGPNLVASGCGRTVNDYLREAESGAPEAVEEAVVAIGDLLVYKETAAIEFDEGDRKAVEYLTTVARQSAIPSHRALAVQSLGRLRPGIADEVIIALLEDPFWLARYLAIAALRRSGDPRHAQLLADRLEKDTEPAVRLQAVKTLGELGGPIALRQLYRVFLSPARRSSDEQVQAYLALRRLTGLDYEIHETSAWQKAFDELSAGGSGARDRTVSLPREDSALDGKAR